MKKTKNRIDILITKGHYTVNPFHLKKVLTESEYTLLDIIRYESSISKGYISNTLIELEIGFTKGSSIARLKKNLIALEFIKIIEENKNKGTLYSIDYNVISNIVESLNNERNPINRLIIADNYRTSKGLNSILYKRINKFKDTSFNINNEINRYISINNSSNIKEDIDEIKSLNILYQKLSENKISEEQYRIQTNNIKASSKYKITFNKTDRKWENTNMN